MINRQFAAGTYSWARRWPSGGCHFALNDLFDYYRAAEKLMERSTHEGFIKNLYKIQEKNGIANKLGFKHKFQRLTSSYIYQQVFLLSLALSVAIETARLKCESLNRRHAKSMSSRRYTFASYSKWVCTVRIRTIHATRYPYGSISLLCLSLSSPNHFWRSPVAQWLR